MRRASFILFAALLTSACVSRINVAAVNKGTEKGVRYYLPKSYLLISPAPDGTVVVEKVFLPDPERQYAIDAKSIGGKYKLSVQLDEKGLLKKVIWNTTDAESTKAALDAAANIQKARIDAEVAAAKAADEKAKKAAEARAAAVAAVEAAKLELAQAEAALGVFEAVGVDAKDAGHIAARVAVEKAKMKLLAAQQALSDLDAAAAESAADTDTSALREPQTLNDLPDEKWPIRAWGPVLFEVEEDLLKGDDGITRATKVALRPVNDQAYMPSSKKLVDAPPDVTPQANIRGSAVFRKTGKPIRFVIQPDTPVVAPIDRDSIVLVRNGDEEIDSPQDLITLNLNRNNDIFADLEPSIKKGDYELTFTVQVMERGKAVGKDVTVEFEVK